ncbi:IclR family transcriptional regulator [Actinomadura atramentaria]|uniref:IclR family transcriptional regulator n=1 Tax=Actinomadura atramentaria TaxID=1990 RepID=UPI00036539E5|nr:IclR family transcriptional regulator [Actinomadura atramentaria]
MPAKSHRTIDRVTRILEIVSARPQGMTLTELSREMDAPKSSIQGFVYGLVHTGFLEEHERRYFLGPAPYVLTLRANRLPARTVAHSDLVGLHERTGCSVLLGVKVGQNVVYVDEVGDTSGLQFVAYTRRHRPVLRTAAGKALLAFLDDRELHELLAVHPDQDGIGPFLAEVDEIRRTGFVINEQSPVEGVTAVAAPVRDRAGHVVAAVTLAGPVEENAHRRAELGAVLREATARWAGRPADA